MKHSQSVIIVAGGKGMRMQSAIPKQFLFIGDKPILMHTITKFYTYDSNMEIVVVLPKDDISYWQNLCTELHFTIEHKIVAGGSSRFFSVKNGLSQLSQNNNLIAIHDGVRPLVSIATIKKCFEKAQEKGSAIPTQDMIESIREIKGNQSIAVDRSKYKLVQTPQVFRSEILTKSYEQSFQDYFTDDASVVEAAGFDINLVEGNRTNIKITNTIDLELAKLLLTIEDTSVE